jgi:phosphotransacetylase
MAQPVHVLQRGAEVNEIVNLAVLAALDALEHRRPVRPTH